MNRSYYLLPLGKLELLSNPKCYNADSIIIDIDDYLLLMKQDNYQTIIDELITHNVSIYLSLHTKDINNTYKKLNDINHLYISGWFIPNVNCNLLNRYNVKAREIEASKKLNFLHIKFIPLIDNPKAVINIRKIASYNRIEMVAFDSYAYGIGINTLEPNNPKIQQIRITCANMMDLSKKYLIDGVKIGNLSDDLEYSKQLGSIGKLCNDLDDIPTINEFFIPSKEQITKSLEVMNIYRSGNKKQYVYDNHPLTANNILYSNLIIERARALNLIDDYQPVDLVVNQEKLKIRKPKEIKRFYALGEEIGNAVTHGLGAIAQIVFIILLVLKYIANPHGYVEIASYIVYCLCGFILYMASTLYHALPTGSSGKRVFQRFDHMTIYLLIAGTYTPFSLLALNSPWSNIICAFLWTGAAVGLTLNAIWFGRFRAFHIILYLALGWTAVGFMPMIISNIGFMGTMLMLAGGISYTLGIIFYSLRLFKYTHMIWHIFVLMGSVLMYLSIYLCL